MIQSDTIVKVLHQSDAISGVLHQNVAISFFKIHNKILPNLQKNFLPRFTFFDFLQQNVVLRKLLNFLEIP